MERRTITITHAEYTSDPATTYSGIRCAIKESTSSISGFDMLYKNGQQFAVILGTDFLGHIYIELLNKEHKIEKGQYEVEKYMAKSEQNKETPTNPAITSDIKILTQTILNLIELGLPIPTKLTKLYNKTISK